MLEIQIITGSLAITVFLGRDATKFQSCLSTLKVDCLRTSAQWRATHLHSDGSTTVVEG